MNDFEIAPIKRRYLLPWWIKGFCWLFMATAFIAILRMILLLFYINTEFEFYGLNAKENTPINGIIVFLVFTMHGFTAYSLWFEKDYGIKIGVIDSLIGIVLCLFSMIISFYHGHFTIRLEMILLILFLVKLLKIRLKWDSMTPAAQSL